eukprot:GEMP01045070.1.p1 GENE.GEMP01045070.1~~GEMP01045070.1.p1  ORF type:complete len:370 (+),score=20.76 GEMP01045070.1:60-1169(+)
MFARLSPKFISASGNRHLIAFARPSCLNSPCLVPINGLRLIASAKALRDIHLPLPSFLPVGNKEDLERIAILEVKVEEARTPRNRSLYQKPEKRIERLDSDGNLRCTKCGVFKTVDSFSYRTNSRHGRSYECRLCQTERTMYFYGYTLRGIMSVFLRDAKASSARRSAVAGREDAGFFDIDLMFLLNLWQKQKGRCAYSGIVMNTEPWTSWRISIERLNNNRGYVPDNVCFTCSELNTTDNSVNAKYAVLGSSKWSREKLHSLPEVSDSSVPLNDAELEEIAAAIPKRKGLKYSKRQVAANGDIFCPSCSKFMSIDNFYFHARNLFNRQHFCKPCLLATHNEYRNTQIGFLRTRVHSAKLSAKVRANNG